MVVTVGVDGGGGGVSDGVERGRKSRPLRECKKKATSEISDHHGMHEISGQLP